MLSFINLELLDFILLYAALQSDADSFLYNTQRMTRRVKFPQQFYIYLVIYLPYTT